MSEISIILVEPQMGENIGAAARAMKNFGIQNLRIVAPRDGWPNDKARSMSVGAIDIINRAEIYNSLPAALEDLSYIYATTAMPRSINKEYILSRDLAAEIKNKSAIGILFGRENYGLSNEEISYANKIITIDTDIKFSSLNIAHAVALVTYELFQYNNNERQDLKIHQKAANQVEIEHFYNHLFMELDKRAFFRVPEKKLQMTQKIRNIFSRIDNLSQSELQTLRGIVKVLSEK